MPRPARDLAPVAPWLDDRLTPRSAEACARVIVATFPRDTLAAVASAFAAYGLRTDVPAADSLDAWLLAVALREYPAARGVASTAGIDALAPGGGPLGADPADPRDVRAGGNAARVGPGDASAGPLRGVRARRADEAPAQEGDRP